MVPGTTGVITDGAFTNFRAVVRNINASDDTLELTATVFGREVPLTLPTKQFRPDGDGTVEPAQDITRVLGEIVALGGVAQRLAHWWAREARANSATDDDALAVLGDRFALFERTLGEEARAESDALRAEILREFPDDDEARAFTQWMNAWDRWTEARAKGRTVKAELDRTLTDSPPEPLPAEAAALVSPDADPDSPEMRLLEAIFGAPANPTGEFYTQGRDLRERAERAVRRRERKLHPLDGPSPATPIAQNEAFEAAIEAEPQNAARWHVYADWLTDHGDVRGELMALQLARTSSVASERERSLLQTHARYFLGNLAPDADSLKIRWRNGFIDGAQIVLTREQEEEGLDAPAMLRTLLALPAARFLRALTVGAASSYEDGLEENTLAALRSRGTLGSLESLTFETLLDEEMLSWTSTGDLSQLPPMPRLKELIVNAGQVDLPAPDFPGLETLVLKTCNLTPERARAICAARWPALDTLILWFGSLSYGVETTAADLTDLLAAKSTPALRHLALANNEFADDLCEALVTSPLISQLVSLDLSQSTLTDTGVQTLARHASQLRTLQKLTLSENYLSPEGVSLAGTLAPVVVADDQRVSELYNGEPMRYCAVAE